MSYYYKPIRTKSALNGYIEYESKGDKDKILSPREYFCMIRSYLIDLINDYKSQGVWKVNLGNKIIDYKTQSEWKIQLTIKINFISPKDSEETRNISTKNDNVQIMMGSETNKIIEELFKSLLQRYQEKLEELMK